MRLGYEYTHLEDVEQGQMFRRRDWNSGIQRLLGRRNEERWEEETSSQQLEIQQDPNPAWRSCSSVHGIPQARILE